MSRRWQTAYVVIGLLLAIVAVFERRWGSGVVWGLSSIFWATLLWKERNKDERA
jgi:hypothetical protein